MTRRALHTGIWLLVCLVALAATNARADVQYTYTGKDFTNALSPYTTNDKVTGYIIFPTELAPNLLLQRVYPTAWSFTDGVYTFSQSSPINIFNEFQLQTGPGAAITGCDFTISDQSGNGIYSLTVSIGMSIEEGLTTHAIMASNENRSGTWTEEPIPEPTSAALFVTAVLGIVGLGRRRKRIDPGQ